MTTHGPGQSEEYTRQWTSVQPAVSAYLAAQVLDFRDAQDLLQSVAVTGLRKYDDYDRARPFVAWILGIARLEVLRLRRDHARSRLVLDPEVAARLEEACGELAQEFEHRSRHLAACVAELEGRAAELIRLRYDEALSPAAIAERLGMAGVAVRVALNRAREWLRRCVERKLGREDVTT